MAPPLDSQGAGQELPGEGLEIPYPEPGFLPGYGCGPLLPVGRQWGSSLAFIPYNGEVAMKNPPK